jgi:hypothetical protein
MTGFSEVTAWIAIGILALLAFELVPFVLFACYALARGEAWMVNRIPKITLVDPATMTPTHILADTSYGLMHRCFVFLDMAIGQLGAQAPDITISARTAIRCIEPVNAPMWALLLGTALETPWALPGISYHGHLHGAIVTDWCRSQRASWMTSIGLGK